MESQYLQYLERARDEAGIEDHYWDLWGQRHEASPEAVSKMLASFGRDTSSVEALDLADTARRVEDAQRLIPETLVVRHDEQPLRLDTNAEGVEFSILTEAGERHSWSGSAEIPITLSLGYHRLEASNTARADSAHLIVCPAQAYLPAEGAKFAGLGVFLPGVRDAGTWGCGDFRALAQLCVWAAKELKAAYVALNPLHAIHNRTPYNTSPYLPNSLLYRNFIYLDIPTLADFSECTAAVEMMAASEVREEIARLNASELVDYEGVARLKHAFLLQIFRSFQKKHIDGKTARGKAFEAYCEREGRPLELFALYSTLDVNFHALDENVWNWPQWPEEYRDPDSKACRAFARDFEWSCLFYSWVQWQIDEQIGEVQRQAKAAGMPIGLFHDLPLATDRFGAEVWGHRELYLEKGSVGAPPDAAAPQGQDWGFPPPNREAHRRDGFQHFAHTIRASARHGGALRLDHVMRLFRLFCIPDGMSIAEGVYVRDYSRELLGVVALESVRNQVIIIGEDLGTVADGVREALRDAGVLSYRLLYFERETDNRFRVPEAYPPRALVSITTHDLPTIAGYWQGRDLELRRECGLITDDQAIEQERRDRQVSKQGILDALHEAGLLPADFSRDVAHYPELTGELHNAMVGFLATSPSLLMTVNQEDLTKETEQQNLPGTVHQYPNWRRKMRQSLEELTAETSYATMLRNWVERTGRA